MSLHQVKLWLKFNIHEIDVRESSMRVKWWFIHRQSRLGFEAVEFMAPFTLGSHWERRKSGSWLFWNTAVPSDQHTLLPRDTHVFFFLFLEVSDQMFSRLPEHPVKNNTLINSLLYVDLFFFTALVNIWSFVWLLKFFPYMFSPPLNYRTYCLSAPSPLSPEFGRS